jgi:hypothetical protein
VPGGRSSEPATWSWPANMARFGALSAGRGCDCRGNPVRVPLEQLGVVPLENRREPIDVAGCHLPDFLDRRDRAQPCVGRLVRSGCRCRSPHADPHSSASLWRSRSCLTVDTARTPTPRSPPYRRSWTYERNGTPLWDRSVGRQRPVSTVPRTGSARPSQFQGNGTLVGDPASLQLSARSRAICASWRMVAAGQNRGPAVQRARGMRSCGGRRLFQPFADHGGVGVDAHEP